MGSCESTPAAAAPTKRTANSSANAASKDQRVLNIVHFNDVYNIDAVYKEEPVGGTSN